VRIGTLLYGYCGGRFGRDSYDRKRVEALGVDWVVARNEDGFPLFADCRPEELEKYSTDESAKLGDY
jgi:hypothetical protein